MYQYSDYTWNFCWFWWAPYDDRYCTTSSRKDACPQAEQRAEHFFLPYIQQWQTRYLLVECRLHTGLWFDYWKHLVEGHSVPASHYPSTLVPPTSNSVPQIQCPLLLPIISNIKETFGLRNTKRLPTLQWNVFFQAFCFFVKEVEHWEVPFKQRNVGITPVNDH